MNKVIRTDSNKRQIVAILYSPRYGAGWFTCNPNHPECLFNPDIINLVLAQAPVDEINKLAAALWPDGYWSAAGLRVEWIKLGMAFQVNEVGDGYEEILTSDDWMVA